MCVPLRRWRMTLRRSRKIRTLDAQVARQRGQRAELQGAHGASLLTKQGAYVFRRVFQHTAIKNDVALFLSQFIERGDDLAPALASAQHGERVILIRAR